MVTKKKTKKSSRSPKVSNNLPITSRKDVSNRMVIIMLVVVVLISVVSMVVYLQALETAKPKMLINEAVATGGVVKSEVKLTLLPHSESEEKSVEEQSSMNSMAGQVILTIVPLKK
jgi:cytoskeletal protein RodZ